MLLITLSIVGGILVFFSVYYGYQSYRKMQKADEEAKRREEEGGQETVYLQYSREGPEPPIRRRKETGQVLPEHTVMNPL